MSASISYVNECRAAQHTVQEVIAQTSTMTSDNYKEIMKQSMSILEAEKETFKYVRYPEAGRSVLDNVGRHMGLMARLEDGLNIHRLAFSKAFISAALGTVIADLKQLEARYLAGKGPVKPGLIETMKVEQTTFHSIDDLRDSAFKAAEKIHTDKEEAQEEAYKGALAKRLVQMVDTMKVSASQLAKGKQIIEKSCVFIVPMKGASVDIAALARAGTPYIQGGGGTLLLDQLVARQFNPRDIPGIGSVSKTHDLQRRSNGDLYTWSVPGCTDQFIWLIPKSLVSTVTLKLAYTGLSLGEIRSANDTFKEDRLTRLKSQFNHFILTDEVLADLKEQAEEETVPAVRRKLNKEITARTEALRKEFIDSVRD